MTDNKLFAFSRRIAPELCKYFSRPLKSRGRRECRMRAAPEVSCASGVEKCAHEHTGQRRHIRHSLRNGFTAYNVISPVGPCSLSPSLRNEMRDSCKLDASIGASGPHVFAVRFRAFRQGHFRVHRSPPRVRDVRERPSGRDGMTIICHVLHFCKSEIFFISEFSLDNDFRKSEVICPSGYYVAGADHGDSPLPHVRPYQG